MNNNQVPTHILLDVMILTLLAILDSATRPRILPHDVFENAECGGECSYHVSTGVRQSAIASNSQSWRECNRGVSPFVQCAAGAAARFASHAN